MYRHGWHNHFHDFQTFLLEQPWGWYLLKWNIFITNYIAVLRRSTPSTCDDVWDFSCFIFYFAASCVPGSTPWSFPPVSNYLHLPSLLKPCVSLVSVCLLSLLLVLPGFWCYSCLIWVISFGPWFCVWVLLPFKTWHYIVLREDETLFIQRDGAVQLQYIQNIQIQNIYSAHIRFTFKGKDNVLNSDGKLITIYNF